MTNTPDKSEMKACPFPHEVKRGVFVEVDTVDFGFARVSCSDCGCAGPYVTLANHERATKAEKAEAIAAWNTRSRPADQVPDMVERLEADLARTDCRNVMVQRSDLRAVIAAFQAVPAALIQQQQATIERLSAALEDCRDVLRDVPAPHWVAFWRSRILAAIRNADAALGKDASDE